MKRETEIKESQEATETELEKRRAFSLISQFLTRKMGLVEEEPNQPGKEWGLEKETKVNP